MKSGSLWKIVGQVLNLPYRSAGQVKNLPYNFIVSGRR
jgi:hypothetical protein